MQPLRSDLTDAVPQAAARLIERAARARPARALHHQHGGAELHRQHAAGRRLRAVDDAVGRGDRRLRRRAPTRCWSISAPSMPERREATGDRRRRGRTSAGMPWVLDPVFIDRCAAARRFRARSWSARGPRVRAAQPRRVQRARRRRARRATRWRALRARTATVVALTGATDLVTDGARVVDHRQRPSADGQGHRDGLRRLGAGRRPASRSSRTRWRASGGGADRARRRRRDRGASARRARAASPSRSSTRSTRSTRRRSIARAKVT